ncbi:MAG: serine protease [Candidatus Nitrosopolaris sp.]
MFSTVRINCTVRDKKGIKEKSGTGFIFDFFRNPKDNVPVIVCNKHVIQNSIHGCFVFNSADENGSPLFGQPITCSFDEFIKNWIFHPDPTIDLAIMPIGGVVTRLMEERRRVYYTSISSSTIPQNEEWEKFIVLEQILVIGYPNALMDTVNNLSIFRKGTTASHPNIPFEGRNEFLVDVGVFPGSSGSPVFLLNKEFYEKSRELKEGPERGRLLGIISSGPMFTAEGIIIENEPQTEAFVTGQLAMSRIPMDIGIAIKSTKLLDFKPILKEECAKLGIEIQDD